MLCMTSILSAGAFPAAWEVLATLDGPWPPCSMDVVLAGNPVTGDTKCYLNTPFVLERRPRNLHRTSEVHPGATYWCNFPKYSRLSSF